MSGQATYFLLCNVIGCRAAVTPELGERLLAQVRERARIEFGWRHEVVLMGRGGVSPSVDLCSEHGHLADRPEDLRALCRNLGKGEGGGAAVRGTRR